MAAVRRRNPAASPAPGDAGSLAPASAVARSPAPTVGQEVESEGAELDPVGQDLEKEGRRWIRRIFGGESRRRSRGGAARRGVGEGRLDRDRGPGGILSGSGSRWDSVGLGRQSREVREPVFGPYIGLL